MSTYTKKRCPGCGYVLENWHKDNEFWRTRIGPAAIPCPRCRRYLSCDSNVEFIMLKHPKLFIAQFLLIDLFKSAIFGGLLGLLLCSLLDLDVYFLCSAISIVIFFVLHCVALKLEISRSLKRTSEYQYRDVLRRLGRLHISKLGDP
jgi:hypothetical protein